MDGWIDVRFCNALDENEPQKTCGILFLKRLVWHLSFFN